MHSLIPAVHCVSEWWELKWNRYRFRPAVDILSTFVRGGTSGDLVGRVSICGGGRSQCLHATGTGMKVTIFIDASVRLRKVGTTSPS